jgi:triacylglycerol lipase
MNNIKYFLWFLFILMVTAIMYLFIKIIFMFLNAKKAIHEAWFNTKYCNEKKCLPSEDQLNENLPTNIKLGEWNIDIAKYCSIIIYSIEKAAQNNIKPLYPKDLVIQKELYNNTEDPIFGAVFTQGNNIWISFRGTLSEKEWEQDFRYQQESMLDKQSIEQVSLDFIKNISGKVANVHKGFLDVYMKFRNNLTSTLKKINPDKKMTIIISGHSLGAAISTIAGADLIQYGYNVNVYNFASPRVGNKIFADFVDNEMKLSLYRIVNISDIVPNMPPCISPNFNDTKNPFIYTHCGTAVNFKQNRLSVLNNHLISAYMAGLQELN